jgi:putative endonuclease
MTHIVYILFSEKLNRHYTGYTTNTEQRLHFHENAETRKFTYKADDWKLIFTIVCGSEDQALAIEKHIKSMKSKTYIQNLIKYPEMSLKLKEKYSV